MWVCFWLLNQPGFLGLWLFWFWPLLFCKLSLVHLEPIGTLYSFWSSFVGKRFCENCSCAEYDSNEVEVVCFSLNSCTNWLAFVTKQSRSLISNSWDSISGGKHSLNLSIIWALVAPIKAANRSNFWANSCTVCWSELKCNLFQAQLRSLSVSPHLLNFFKKVICKSLVFVILCLMVWN